MCLDFSRGVDEVRDSYHLRIFLLKLRFLWPLKMERRKAIKPIFHYVSLKWCPWVKGWRTAHEREKRNLASGYCLHHSNVNANKVIWPLSTSFAPQTRRNNKVLCILDGAMNVFVPIYLLSFLITISWCHNRIVILPRSDSLKEMLSSWNVPLRADFPELSCFTLKLHPVQRSFQCSWDTNPCRCSYHRPRMSIKKLHYILLRFKGSLWLLMCRSPL